MYGVISALRNLLCMELSLLLGTYYMELTIWKEVAVTNTHKLLGGISIALEVQA